MGDTDATAMARMTAEVEEEEVDVMELVRRLQESRSEGMRDEPGTGASATAAKAHEKGFASMVKTTGVATLDEESKKGQFGWFPVLGVQMPYIIRSETPYIPTKVIERSVFGELLGEIPKECVECVKLDAVNFTEAEAKLFNEINLKHTSGCFGKEIFSGRDKMVQREEFEKFVTYLLFCRKTVVMGEAPEESARCGVAKLKGERESTKLPYTMMGGAKWVPLAYFEGEVGDLRANAKAIRSWELFYLRLAARIIGGEESGAKLAKPNCQVVRLDTIISCYPTKPKVEDGWKASKMMSRAQSSVTANYTVMCQSGPRRKYQGKLTLIKEFPEDGSGPAYKWLPTQVEDLKLAGVNVKPRQWHDLMIPLHDLVATMSGLEVEAAGTCLAERGTNLFRGNLGQSAVLETEGKAAQWDPCPLVRVGDARKHLAALKVECANAPANKKKRWDYDSDSDYSD